VIATGSSKRLAKRHQCGPIACPYIESRIRDNQPDRSIALSKKTGEIAGFGA